MSVELNTPADNTLAETAVEQELAQKSYVLDTSVLLSDPKAVLRFAEHEVIIPVVVISELEKKRHDSDLGYYARSALRLLDELRTTHGALNQPIPLNDDGGHLLVELNHISLEVLPHGFRGADNDSRILAVAKSFADEGRDVTVVSKDLPMRVKASAMGSTPMSTATNGSPTRAGPVWPRSPPPRSRSASSTTASTSTWTRWPRCPPTPDWSSRGRTARPWAGSTRTPPPGST